MLKVNFSFDIKKINILKVICHPTCSQCSGPNSNECSNCYVNAQLTLSFECFCLSQYYYLEHSPCLSPPCSECLICNSNCNECTGPLDSDCIACAVTLKTYANQCISSCPLNTWISSTNPTLCVNSCNSDEYEDITTNSCKKCDSSCLTCEGTSASDCKTCLSSSFLYQKTCITSCPIPLWRASSSLLCETSCQINQYGDPNDRTCKECDASCNSCSNYGPSDCLTCSGSLYFLNGACFSMCPSLFWAINQICVSDCDSSCLTCEGPSASDCKTCLSSSFLYQKTCITICSIPLWRASSSLLCETSCQINQYGDPNDRTCKECDASCNSCSNSGPANCLTCSGSLYFLQGACFSMCPIFFWAINQICVSDCGVGKFGDNFDRKCKICDSKCNTCVGATSNDCSSCNAGFFIENGQCVLTCKSGFYGNVSTNTCEICESSCLSCKGPTSHDCLSCVDAKNYLENFICGINCSENLFERDETKTCEVCITNNCLKCYRKWNRCKQCEDGYVLFSNGSCLKKIYLYPTLIKDGEKNEFNLSCNYSIGLSENDLQKFLKIFIETPIKYNYTIVRRNDSLLSLYFTFLSNITKEIEFSLQLNEVFLQSKHPNYFLNETDLKNKLSILLLCPTEYITQGKNILNFSKILYFF